MPYWHEHNPWADRLVYVPVDEFLDCVYPQPENRQRMADHINLDMGGRADCYLLPNNGLGWISAGIRYGENGPNYYSPMGDQLKLAVLLNKYAERTDEVF